MLIDLKQFRGPLGDQIAGSDPVPSFSGAAVDRSTALVQNIMTFTVAAPIWSTELYDVGGWWVPGSPTLFTVPGGVTRVRTTFVIRFDNPIAASLVLMTLQVNGATFARPSQATYLTNPNIPLAWHSPSPSFSVRPGDQIACVVGHLGTPTLALPANSAETTFAIEAV